MGLQAMRQATRTARRALLAGALAVSLTGIAAVPARAADWQGHWAEGYVDSLTQAGVIALPEGGEFRPDEPVTRLDFAVWVARAMELAPEAADAPLFTDWEEIPVEDRPWVAAAVKAGLVGGYPEPGGGPGARSFRPGNPIVRAELATVLGRALVRLGVQPQARYLYLFEDREEIPGWALDAMASVQEEVIMGRPGLSLVRFAPRARTTRAEAAVMIVRFLNARARLLPAAKPAPPPALKPKVIISSYYINTDGAYRSLLAHGGELNMLFYFSYPLDARGEFAGGYYSRRTMEAASRFGLPVLAVVKNFNRREISALLADDRARERAVQNILGLMEQGYAGVNLDFEMVDPDDRDRFTRFVGEVAAALKPRGYLTTVALMARDERTANSSWGRAYDYNAIGRLVDYVVVMTYDQHYSGSAPGPVGGLDWADGVMAYAASQVAPDKLLLGIPAYAYDWPESGGSAKARPVTDWEGNDEFYSVEELLQREGALAEMDPQSAETLLRYVDDGGAPRLVYYTDARGLRLKLMLVNKHRLAGVAMWRLGFEPEGYWDAYRALASGALPGDPASLAEAGRLR